MVSRNTYVHWNFFLVGTNMNMYGMFYKQVPRVKFFRAYLGSKLSTLSHA